MLCAPLQLQRGYYVVVGSIEQLQEGRRLDPAEAGEVREVGKERLDAEPWVGGACHGMGKWGLGGFANEDLCAGQWAVGRWEIVVVETEMGLAQKVLAAAGSLLFFAEYGRAREEV